MGHILTWLKFQPNPVQKVCYRKLQSESKPVHNHPSTSIFWTQKYQTQKDAKVLQILFYIIILKALHLQLQIFVSFFFFFGFV